MPLPACCSSLVFGVRCALIGQSHLGSDINYNLASTRDNFEERRWASLGFDQSEREAPRVLCALVFGAWLKHGRTVCRAREAFPRAGTFAERSHRLPDTSQPRRERPHPRAASHKHPSPLHRLRCPLSHRSGRAARVLRKVAAAAAPAAADNHRRRPPLNTINRASAFNLDQAIAGPEPPRLVLAKRRPAAHRIRVCAPSPLGFARLRRARLIRTWPKFEILRGSSNLNSPRLLGSRLSTVQSELDV